MPTARTRIANGDIHKLKDEAGREDGGARVLDLLDRLFVAVRIRQRLRAGEHRLDATALVGGDALLEEGGVDAELRGQPFDRLMRRARLAPLDLADVFLREPVAREIRLRQARGHAQLPQALAEA